MWRLFAAVSLLALATAACSSKSNPAAPTNTTLPHGSMSATIDGTQWVATTGLSVTYNQGILAAAGVDNSLNTLAFAVFASAPGTYPIGATSPTNALFTMNSNGSKSWQAASTLGSGSVTVTTLTATGATGTFSFTLVANGGSGASGNKVVTNGKFNLKF
jgi:Family of unknown function (DUF6252)